MKSTSMLLLRVALLTGLLAACGLKGDLYLPADGDEAAVQDQSRDTETKNKVEAN